MCLIYRCLSSASAVIRSWFIYELQKSTTIAFSRNSLYTFYSRNPTCGVTPCLRISNRKYPSCPQNSIIVNPPPPLGNPKSRPWYGMDIFWNHPIILLLLHSTLKQPRPAGSSISLSNPRAQRLTRPSTCDMSPGMLLKL